VLSNVQNLRALAAYMVVVHHVLTLNLGPHLAGQVPRIGASGVDVFFVVSGFIMVHTTRGERGEAADFVRRRLRRILPLYWLVTLAIFAACLAGLRPNGLSAGDGSAANLLDSLAFIPFRRESGEILPLVAVGWTLAYEMLFYAVFAIGLALRRSVPVLATVGLTLGLLVGIGLAAGPFAAAPAFVFTRPLLLEFLAGCLIAELHYRSFPVIAPRKLVAAGAAALALGVALLGCGAWTGLDVEQYGASRALVWGGPAALIVAGAVALEAAGRGLDSPFLRLQGDASYATYLVHMLVIQAATKLVVRLAPELPAVPVAAGLVLLCGLAGTLVHLWIERPLMAALRAIGRRNPAPAIADVMDAVGAKLAEVRDLAVQAADPVLGPEPLAAGGAPLPGSAMSGAAPPPTESAQT
jgi:exopolysaccharide production protein ExoZ